MDYSTMSDQQLLQTIGADQGQVTQAPQQKTGAVDYSSMPDNQLLQAIGANPTQDESSNDIPLVPNILGKAKVQEGSSPLNVGERFNLGTIRTEEYKVKYLQELFPKAQINQLEDGRLTINGEVINPKSDGIAQWLKNSVGNISEWAGGSALPLGGQILADMGMVSAAPATGGASLLGLAGAGLAGASAGELVQQYHANKLIHEPFSAGDVGFEAGLGAATPYIGKMIEPMAKTMLRPFGIVLNKIGDKLNPIAPEVSAAITGVEKGQFDHIFAEKAKGRSIADILTPKNADSNAQVRISKRVLFGDETADASPEGLIRQYNRLVKPVYNDPARKSVVKEMFQSLVPELDDNALNMMERHGVNLLDPKYLKGDAYTVEAKNIADILHNQERTLGQRFDPVFKEIHKTGSKIGAREVNTGKVFQEFMDSLKMSSGNRIGLVNEEGQLVKSAGSETTVDLFKKFFKNLGIDIDVDKGIAVGITKHDKQALAEKMRISVSEVEDLIKTGDVTVGNMNPRLKAQMEEAMGVAGKINKLPEQMTIAELDKGLVRNKFLINKAENLDGSEKAMFFKLIKNLRGEIANKYAPYGQVNKAYSLFEDASEAMGLKDFGQSGQDKVRAIIKQISDTKAADQTMRFHIKEIDSMISRNQSILTRIDKFNAAQKVFGSDLVGAEQNFIRTIRGVNSKDPAKALVQESLSKFDSAIKQQMYKFLTDSKDTAAAQTLANRQVNYFKGRALAYMLGAGTVFHINPLLGIGAIGATIGASSPKNYAKLILGAEKLGAKATSMSKGQGTLGKFYGQPKGRAVLAGLLRSKQ
jgi:hypothetical protein